MYRDPVHSNRNGSGSQISSVLARCGLDGAMVDMVSPLASCGSTVRVDQVKIPIMSTAIQRERVVLTFCKDYHSFPLQSFLYKKVSTTQNTTRIDNILHFNHSKLWQIKP